MVSYHNDSPIETAANDLYGISPFAEAIARSILGVQKPVGTTIAIHGPWGVGKSSAVNLIRTALATTADANLTVTDFRCWWYRGEDALALAFLQHIHSLIHDKFSDDIKKIIPGIARRLLQGAPVVGHAVALLSGVPVGSSVTAASNFAEKFFSDDESIEKMFSKLATALENQDRRFLVIIDDIDRLSPDEALAIFRLVKSVGRLPNVLYLLVFDRQLAEKIVQERYPSEGPQYLDKIIQAGFDVPQPAQTDLNEAAVATINIICGNASEDQKHRASNIFIDVVAPYMTTPRHVIRYGNAISVTWPAIAGEVNVGDFIALEALRLYEPGLFLAIRFSANDLCGTSADGYGGRGGLFESSHDPDKRFERFLFNVPDERKEVAKNALVRLFPRMERMTYGSEWRDRWSADRRVCVAEHFSTYFRMSLSEDSLSLRDIDELISRAVDRDFVQETLRRAASVRRRNGQTMIPVYFDELRRHSGSIAKADVQPFLAALFEVFDDFDRAEDDGRGFSSHVDTRIRVHWLMRRATKDRFSIDERTELYLAATEKASLGWQADFVVSAQDDHRERENGQRIAEDDHLVAESALVVVVERTLSAIRAAAADGSLIRQRRLAQVLHVWRRLCADDPREVRAWTDGLLNNDVAVIALAQHWTGQSWSASMGGNGSLGDRVAKATPQALIDSTTEVVDVERFRAVLERIRAEQASTDDARLVAGSFLDAWDRTRRGEDD